MIKDVWDDTPKHSMKIISPPQKCFDCDLLANTATTSECLQSWNQFWYACRTEDKLSDPICVEPETRFMRACEPNGFTLSEAPGSSLKNMLRTTYGRNIKYDVPDDECFKREN